MSWRSGLSAGCSRSRTWPSNRRGLTGARRCTRDQCLVATCSQLQSLLGNDCHISAAWGRSVNSIAECTVPEKILLAARLLEDKGQSPFSAEALIVASWQKFPRTFGLKGFTDQYPDSNKVLSCIMG